jgi:hypothetical protein
MQYTLYAPYEILQHIFSSIMLNIILAVPWLRRLAAGFPLQRHWFALGSVHVWLVVDRRALGQIFLRGLQFSPVIIIPPGLIT